MLIEDRKIFDDCRKNFSIFLFKFDHSKVKIETTFLFSISGSVFDTLKISES